MVDKRALVDSVTIQKQEDKDDWGKASYSDPLLLSNVRMHQALSTIQQEPRTRRIANQVFCLCTHNTVMCRLTTLTVAGF